MTITAKEQWLKYVADTKHDLCVDTIVTAKAEAFLEFLEVVTKGLGDDPRVSLVDMFINVCEDLEYHVQNAQDEAIEKMREEEKAEAERERARTGGMSDEQFDYLVAIGRL